MANKEERQAAQKINTAFKKAAPQRYEPYRAKPEVVFSASAIVTLVDAGALDGNTMFIEEQHVERERAEHQKEIEEYKKTVSICAATIQASSHQRERAEAAEKQLLMNTNEYRISIQKAEADYNAQKILLQKAEARVKELEAESIPAQNEGKQPKRWNEC